MIRVVLFDVDGVLIDISIEKAQAQLQRDWGITPAQTEEFFTHEFIQCLKGEADLKKTLGPYLQKWQWDGSVDTFLDYWFESQKDLNNDLIAFVKKLQDKGVRCFIATNQEKYRTEYLMNKLMFREIFDGVFTSSQLGTTKKHPEFFQKILYVIQLPAEEILYWDDYPAYIESAKSIGIHAEFYANFEQFSKKMEEYFLFETFTI